MTDATDPAVTGESWAAFCDALKRAGDTVIENSTDELDRIEGFRYLSRLARGGLQAFLENGEPPFAQILPIPHNLKIGCDNPDAFYQNVPIDPQYDYRIHGPRGTINYLSLGAYSGGYLAGASQPDIQGHLEDNDPDPEGYVNIIASVEEPASLAPGQRWLRMEPITSTLIIRNFYLDRSSERPSDLTLECLNPPAPGPGPLTAEKLNHGLTMAGLFVQGVTDTFLSWLNDLFADRPNTLEFLPEEDVGGGWADPNQLFRHGSWTLEPGQALIVDVPAIEAYYWNFQLNNMWEESLDYVHCQVTVNQHTARYEADGTARLIIADEDPGFGNWIDTAHHRHGTWGLRYNQVVEDIAPTVSLVAVADLADWAPAEH
ncbi:MAG: hypothetical protein DHS20C19_03900 [Acidimicrobiales bacterium]|nr:MAG: hypothetical protein DHS20C19_03900 [Acidimicrobiales bacterium]